MDQKKTGQFLKTLRNEKGLTQEQLAKHFNVSNRSVSRWETGSNLPDISLLVEIADFYDVDVREIIDGERKSEMMDNETREVAGKMAVYAGNEKGALLRFVQIAGIAGIFISLLSLILQTVSYQPDLRRSGAILATFLAFIVMCVITLYVTGVLQKLGKRKKLVKTVKILTIVAMDSDSHDGFVYAMIPEGSSGNTKITYVAVVFCNYALDVDVHKYMRDEYLLKDFDATDDSPYRKKMLSGI